MSEIVTKSFQRPMIVFESLGILERWLLKWYQLRGIPIGVIEPFHAYHHNRGIRFFPQPLPKGIKEFIDCGAIRLITARELGASEMYLLASDWAVTAVEKVFAIYRRRMERLLQLVVKTTGSVRAEDVFKINLCNRLGEFYSINLLASRVAGLFPGQKIFFYPERNEFPYNMMKKLLLEAGQAVQTYEHLFFPPAAGYGTLKRIKQSVGTILLLTARVIISLFFWGRPQPTGDVRPFSYGIGVIAPMRQLRGTQRDADFLIDEKLLNARDTVYLPLARFTPEQKKKIVEMSDNVFFISRQESYRGRFFPWFKLWRLVITGNYDATDTRSAFILFDNYFKWKSVLKSIRLKHFITHCDFGEPHIGRNIALKGGGVQTWYFTDSLNHACNFADPVKGFHGCHPFWAYLYYDHFVTWDQFLQKNYERHRCSVGQYHVVGCLWSGHIKNGKDTDWSFLDKVPPGLDGRFIIAAFDSTYSCNSLMSYQEGIAFALDLLSLAEVRKDVHIFLKEKKSRSVHLKLDPVSGRELLNVYEKMSQHPRISVVANHIDTASLIGAADFSISFPFTSTTFEAVSARRPAVWHDPCGMYRDTPYGRLGGIMTYNLAELNAVIDLIRNDGPAVFLKKFLSASPLLDPFSDGNAINRFRELLAGYDK